MYTAGNYKAKLVKMHSAKQKAADAAAVAKEHADILKAKAQEKAEKAAARSKEGKEIAHEHMKAKEAEAKMKMHESKAQHAEDKLYGKLHHHHSVGGGTYPLGGYPPRNG